jgi:hypothetical protein
LSFVFLFGGEKAHGVASVKRKRERERKRVLPPIHSRERSRWGRKEKKKSERERRRNFARRLLSLFLSKKKENLDDDAAFSLCCSPFSSLSLPLLPSPAPLFAS